MLTKRNLLYFNSFLFICLLALTFYFVKGASLFAELIPSYDISSFSDFDALKDSGVFKLEDGAIPVDDGYSVYEILAPTTFNVKGTLTIDSLDKVKIIGTVDADGNATTIFEKAVNDKVLSIENASTIIENAIFDGNLINESCCGITISNSKKLELNNVTLKDFKNSGANGIINSEGMLNLNNCLINNNSTKKEGAICIERYGQITTDGCIFTRNQNNNPSAAAYGGAISIKTLNSNSNEFKNCYFGLENDEESGNSVISTSKDVYGGAIYLGQNSKVDNCHFYHNYVSSQSRYSFGGAICESPNSNSCIIMNSVFKYNYNLGVQEIGGAVYLDGNNSIIQNSIFDSNTSQYGGAVAIKIMEKAEIENCTFTRNKAVSDDAYAYGGAIYLDNTDLNEFIIKNCYFGLEDDEESGNTAESGNYDSRGGAIYLGSDCSLDNCYFYYNNATSLSGAAEGGAIYLVSDCSLDNCYFYYNNVTSLIGTAEGGAIYSYQYIKLENSKLKGNYARGMILHGGAVSCESMIFSEITNCIFEDNHLETGKFASGGALYLSGFLNLNDCEFNNNSISINNDLIPAGFYENAVTSLGGAVHNCGFLKINDIKGLNNKATFGGFLYSNAYTYLSGDINVPYTVNNNEIINDIMNIYTELSEPHMYLFSYLDNDMTPGNETPFEYVSTNDKIGLSYFSMNPGEWVATSSNEIDYNDVFDLIKYNVNDDLEVSKELVDSNDYKFVNQFNGANYEVHLARNVNSYDISKFDDVNYDGTNVPALITFSDNDLNNYYAYLFTYVFRYDLLIANTYEEPWKDINSLEGLINFFMFAILPANVTLDSDNSNVTYKNNDKAGRATAVIEGKTDADNNAFLFGTVNIPYDIVCDITSAAADPHIIVDENGDLRLYAAGNIIDSDVTFSNMVNTGSGITYDVECGSSYDTENGDFYKGTKTSVLTKNINYIENDNDGNNDISVDASNRLYKVVDINVSDIITNADSSEIKLNISNKDKNNISSDLTGATKTSYDALKDNKTELGYFDINVTRTDEKDGSPINKGKQSLFTDKTLTLNLKVDKPSDKKYKNYKLLHVHDDGTIDDTNAVVTEEDNKLNFKFTIGDFSNFILLADIDNSGNGSGTGGGSSNTDKPVRTQTITVQIIDHKSIIKGYEDGTFRPQRNITREEIATLFARLSNDYNENVDYTHFISDMGCIDEPLTYWSANYVGYMLSKGYMELEGNKFYPQRYLTRKELVKIICLFKNYEIVNTNSSFKDAYGDKYIATLESKNFVEGYPDGTFKPNNNITRAELSKVIVIMEDRLIKDPTRVNDGLRRELVSKYNDLDKDAWYMPYVFEISYDHSKNLVH